MSKISLLYTSTEENESETEAERGTRRQREMGEIDQETQRDRDRACTISLPNTPDAPFPHTLENPLPFRFHVEFNSERGNKRYQYHLVYILVKV